MLPAVEVNCRGKRIEPWSPLFIFGPFYWWPFWMNKRSRRSSIIWRYSWRGIWCFGMLFESLLSRTMILFLVNQNWPQKRFCRLSKRRRILSFRWITAHWWVSRSEMYCSILYSCWWRSLLKNKYFSL